MRRISKLEAAQRQIDAAIRMLLNEDDILAVHTLAWAAYCIVTDVAKATNSGPGSAGVVFRQLLGGYHREIANFLKHADRDPNDALFEFPEDTPEFLLEIAFIVYESIGGKRTREMDALRQVLDVKRYRYRGDDERRESAREEECLLERQLEDADTDEEREEVYRQRERDARSMQKAYLTLGRKILANEDLFAPREDGR